LDAHGQEIPMLAHMLKRVEQQRQKNGTGGSASTDPRMKEKEEIERKARLFEEYKNRPGLSLTHISPDGSVSVFFCFFFLKSFVNIFFLLFAW
jgi:hypothetical protein